MDRRKDCQRQYGELAEREEPNNQAVLLEEAQEHIQVIQESSEELSGPLPACNTLSNSLSRFQEIIEQLRQHYQQDKARLAASMSRNRQTQDDK